MPKCSELERLWMADKGEPKREFRWQLSPRQWAYLTWLKENTSLGRTEKDVAVFLLTEKIRDMRQSNYSEPQPEGDVSGEEATESQEE